jgi:NTF2 fold immunity protein
MSNNSIFLLLLSCCFFQCNPEQKKPLRSEEKKSILKPDYVPDEITAQRIAVAIWLPLYKEKIMLDTPYICHSLDSTWVVQGTLHSGKGGVPYIEILKKDGRVLNVTHTK